MDGRGQRWKRAQKLLFGVIEVTQFFNEHVGERVEFHGVQSPSVVGEE